ncbi:MAG: FkbM family methyltransferase [Pseudomonadota bacterium]
MMPDQHEIIAELEGFKVPDSPFAQRTGASRFQDGKYERKELEIGMALLKPQDRILEMGAGLGFVGGYLAFKTPGVELWSFEANPNLVPHVERLYDLNGLGERARVSNNVVLTGDDQPEHVRFHIYNCYLGSSLFDRPDKPRPAVDVPTMDWAHITESFQPTFLMMDIEGGELEFLEGATLEGIETVVMEFHPDRYGIDGMKRCKRLLRAAGFEPDAERSSRTVWGCTRKTAA